MERTSALRMGERCAHTDANQSQFTLGADDDADSSMAELPSHRHQGIDERSPLGEVLSEE